MSYDDYLSHQQELHYLDEDGYDGTEPNEPEPPDDQDYDQDKADNDALNAWERSVGLQ